MIKRKIKLCPKIPKSSSSIQCSLVAQLFFICKTKKKKKSKADEMKLKADRKNGLIIKSDWPESVCPLCKSQDFSWFTKRDRSCLQLKYEMHKFTNCTNSKFVKHPA